MDERVKSALFLGREHYGKREFDKAEAVLREVLAYDDRFADVHEMLGVIAHQRGALELAEHHFERALALSPAYTEAALNLAVTYNDQGKYEAARAIYRSVKGSAGRGVGVDPFARGKIANMHAQIGEAYRDASMPREAIEEYEKAITLCPHFSDLRTRLGTLLRETGDVARAREHYEAAVMTKPDYVPALLQLGVTCMMLGETDRAQEQWNRVLDLEPANAQARMYLRTIQLRRDSILPNRDTTPEPFK